jgi:hypothetical protein
MFTHGPRTRLDAQIDAADVATLYRLNRRFNLGIRYRWWRSTDYFRELVRHAMTDRYRAAAPLERERLLARW